MKVKEFVRIAIEKARVDADVAYCNQRRIKFNNDKESFCVDLFNTKSNIAAFEFVFKSQ